jgi:hypothetical protein
MISIRERYLGAALMGASLTGIDLHDSYLGGASERTIDLLELRTLFRLDTVERKVFIRRYLASENA